MAISLSLTAEAPRRIRADVLVAVISGEISLFSEDGLKPLLAPVRKAIAAETLTGDALLRSPAGFAAPQVAVYNADGVRHVPMAEKIALTCHSALAQCAARGFRRIAFLFDQAEGFLPQVVDGLLLGHYAFTKYKSKQNPLRLNVELSVSRAGFRTLKAAVAERVTLAECVNRCRDMVNEPANVMDIDALVKTARETARECGFKMTVLDKAQLRKNNMNGLLTVGGGSRTPPRMVVLRYEPKNAGKEHLCLVGKGILFDSGGISLKPADAMWTMKGDMAGAAAVLCGMRALALRKAPVRVSAVLCLAENMPDANAARPGDIFRASNGKSVQVENTDAEGRLILTDGLFMAGKLKATRIIDFATLTGACVVALGERIAGLMGSDEALLRSLEAASAQSGDRVWRLPLPADYRAMLDTPAADINNITGVRWGGALAGGLFIRDFVPGKTPWAHVDIAGPAFPQRKWGYYCDGATGFGVRLIDAFCGRKV